MSTPVPTRLHLRLYVASESSNSMTALANLKAVLVDRSDLLVEMELIDVLEDPDRGLRDGVLLTPMLVRVEPSPQRRMLGSLRDRALLLSALGLEESAR